MFITTDEKDSRLDRGRAFRELVGSPDDVLVVRSEIPETPDWPAPEPAPVLPVEEKQSKNDRRAEAAVDGLLYGPPAAALMHGTTPASIKTWMTGRVNGSPDVVQELIDSIEQKKTQVRDVAFDRLMASLGVLDEDMLAKAKGPGEAAQVAAQLSRVVDKMMPKDMQDTGEKHVHFHVMVPTVKQESDYLTVEVS